MTNMKAEYMYHSGDDLAVVNAARVSFDKVSDWEREIFDTYSDAEAFGEPDYEYISSDRWMGGYPSKRLSEADVRLIAYLAKHNHWTPFAHNSITLRMSAPVPIRTQCFKHKQGLVENEESRRYIKSVPQLFIPDAFRSAPEGSIKQGSGDTHPDNKQWLVEYQEMALDCIRLYEQMIADGVAPEQARFILPQGVLVNWVWTGNLYAFANFYNKRTDSYAQKEIQDLANMVGEIIEPLFPVSWKALTTK